MESTILTYKADEKGLNRILVDAFRDTKNVDWILELLLCYDENQKLLEELGVSVDDIRTFSTIKRTKAKVTVEGIKLQRLSECESSERKRIKKQQYDKLMGLLNKQSELLEELTNGQ